MSAPNRPWGLLAEYRTPDDLLEAAERVRDAGYTRWDAHAPFPIHGLDGAMGIRPTPLPWLVAVAGFVGCVGGIVLQWWTNAFDYPFLVSGKPYWSIPANIPVAFELTILFAAFTAFLGMIALNGLPRFHHPLFRHERFRRATADLYFISIEAADPLFHPEETAKLLERTGGVRVETVEG